MNFLGHIRALWRQPPQRALSEWFVVEFDDHRVLLRAAPPGKEAWEQTFPWNSIVRICFKDEGQYFSDLLYVFTSQRHEAYVVPTEAKGGDAFFTAVSARGFFPAEIMAKAVSSTDDGFYCWPPLELKKTKANQTPEPTAPSGRGSS